MDTSKWSGKSVLITGVCGTVGHELLRHLASESADRIVGIDNNESEAFFVGEEYRDRDDIGIFLGDIRDRDKLMRKMKGIDIVLHAAALKHVYMCEKSPRDAIQTNILGTQNVIDSAAANGVERVIFTSSDKAVNPSNVMGTSKLMGERLMTASNALTHGDGPIFASTRFGNVLGSHGSVVEVFNRQITGGQAVTLTHKDMTRFIMTLEQSVRLVMDSVFLARGGEVFVTKMPIARIEDLAHAMIRKLAPASGRKSEDVEIRLIGLKPGEKMYEELMNDEETRRTMELDEFFVVLPAFHNIYRKINYNYGAAVPLGVDKPYNSSVEPCMDREELWQYLVDNNLFGETQ